MNREQGVLKSLIVIIAMMFTTAALAQEKCESIGEINRTLVRLLDHVELVPPEETDYIRRELKAALKGAGGERFAALQDRHFYAAVVLRDKIASLMQKVEEAERETNAKRVAGNLLLVLSNMTSLYGDLIFFTQADDKRREPTMLKWEKMEMTMRLIEANGLTFEILLCLVRDL